jgi:hypothetical protein
VRVLKKGTTAVISANLAGLGARTFNNVPTNSDGWNALKSVFQTATHVCSNYETERRVNMILEK